MPSLRPHFVRALSAHGYVQTLVDEREAQVLTLPGGRVVARIWGSIRGAGPMGLAWDQLELTVEHSGIRGRCRMTPGAVWSVARGVDQYPLWAKIPVAASFASVAPVMGLGALLVKGLARAVAEDALHGEVATPEFGRRFDVASPGHDEAVLGCPRALQDELVRVGFVGEIAVVPGSAVIRPHLWRPEGVDAILDAVPVVASALASAQA